MVLINLGILVNQINFVLKIINHSLIHVGDIMDLKLMMWRMPLHPRFKFGNFSIIDCIKSVLVRLLANALDHCGIVRSHD